MKDSEFKPAVVLLSIPQIADVLSVSQRTLFRLMKSPTFPRPVRLGDGNRGTIRFWQKEILDWIESSRQRNEQQ
ncbi:MAG: AlpA family phage regulatory protein [Patescibacteria group bacterium]